jgi:2-polyprenyl-6-methoxyphenol hydroxylase-like FAD-dependent oxidoreductase
VKDENMKIIIVGAGPTGLTIGAGLAHRGHRVVAVDRDPGPTPHGAWRRRGVMQFDQAHGFRPQVRELLRDEWPAAWQAWVGLGAEPIALPMPGGRSPMIGVRSRRITYERALRTAAAVVPGLDVRVGNVERLVERKGRVVGVVVDGTPMAADLVIDASGRLTRMAAAPELNGDVGMAYVSRTYRRVAGAAPGPMSGPIAWTAMLRGYDTYVFPHEHRHVSAVIIRPTADRELGVLRDHRAFDAAARAIPGLAEWTDPSVATPTSGVQVGGGMRNIYRPQALRPGLVTVGDAVSTTAPTAGRGVAMASMQIRALLDLLDGGVDPVIVAEPFDVWCDTWIRPWVEDHLAFDAEAVRRWHGEDLDPTRPLTSTAIVAAAQADTRIESQLFGYLTMTALPSSLLPVEQRARAVYEGGWRPTPAEGPSRDDLVALGRAATADRRLSAVTAAVASPSTNRLTERAAS